MEGKGQGESGKPDGAQDLDNVPDGRLEDEEQGDNAAQQDVGTAAAPFETGTVANGASEGLDEHGEEETGESKQSEVGIFLGFRNEIEEAHGQGDGVEALPEGGEGKAEEGYLDIIQTAERLATACV